MKTYMIFVSQSNTGVLIHIYALPCTDTFIQKTRKLYMDTRTQRNLSKLNDDLFEVQQIMTRNIQEVLGVGDRLDQVSQMSSRLSSESRIFADKAKDLNRQVQCSNISPTDTFCFEGLPNCRLALKPVPSFLFFLDCAH
jgi:vesicle transport protein SEC22